MTSDFNRDYFHWYYIALMNLALDMKIKELENSDDYISKDDIVEYLNTLKKLKYHCFGDEVDEYYYYIKMLRESDELFKTVTGKYFYDYDDSDESDT